VCKELLDLILESNDTKPAIELARERALELLTGDVPHDKLILSQQLGDLENYKSHNMSHIQVHLKMEERKPGSAPQSGDRVPYLLTKTEAGHRAKAFEKAEDPKYVSENEIPVDYHYYFLNKFLKPVSDLLEPLVNDAKEEIFGEIIARYKPPRAKPVRKSKEKQTTLDSIFKNYETTISKSNGSSRTEKTD
jgi:DNA polymerase delta subunit 1